MSNYLTYNENSVQTVKFELEIMLEHCKSLQNTLNNMPMQGVNYAMLEIGLSQARTLDSMLRELKSRIRNHIVNGDGLINITLNITHVFEVVEDKISSFINAFEPAKNLVNFLSFGGIDKLNKANEIMEDMNNKIANLVKDFDDVVALLLANMISWSKIVESNANLSDTTLVNDIWAVKIQPISNFSQMNVWKLIKNNPDIKRKGVMMGFNGEYWDPEKQMQCTLYAAMRRTMIGKPLPKNGAWGNAGSWATSAKKSGVNVDNIPDPGDVFCQGDGFYGHVGVVERVNSDGSILISEANYGFKGAYNTRTIPRSKYAGWKFIS